MAIVTYSHDEFDSVERITERCDSATCSKPHNYSRHRPGEEWRHYRCTGERLMTISEWYVFLHGRASYTPGYVGKHRLAELAATDAPE